MSRALGVHLARVEGSPLSVHAPDRRPAFPAFLAPAVLHVAGLDTRIQYRHRLTGTNGQPSFGPQDLRRFYDSQPLLDEGFVGQGQQLVVLSTAPTPGNGPNAAAIEYFLRNISNSSAQFIQDVISNPDDDFDTQGGLATEFSLDVEMQSVGSPGAKSITLVVAPSSQVFTTGVNHIVNQLSTATAVSVSLGSCEPRIQMFEDGLVASFQQLLQQGLAEGQTWSAASGDNGSDDCMNGATVAVDFPASVPEMVAAGGTSVPSPSWNSANALTAYQTETGWNDGDAGGEAGGGGFSILYPSPGYQQEFSFSGRSVPDIALIAGGPGVFYDNPLPGELFSVGGTSVASPLSAGFFALIASRVGCRLGDVHQTLYTLGNAQLDGGTQVFHDILSGRTDLDGVAGLSAKVGYDQVTGWGSLDVLALANAWPPCQGDAGVPGPVYDPCAILACGGAAVCDTLTDGPSSCIIGCDPNASRHRVRRVRPAVGSPPSRPTAGSARRVAGAIWIAPMRGRCAAPARRCASRPAGRVPPSATPAATRPTVRTGRCAREDATSPATTARRPASRAIPRPRPAAARRARSVDRSASSTGSTSAWRAAPGDSQCRSGYLCQPILGGNSACLPLCPGQWNPLRHLQRKYGSNSVCNAATGACPGSWTAVWPMAAARGDAGGSAVDAGAEDAGVDGGQSMVDSGIEDSGPCRDAARFGHSLGRRPRDDLRRLQLRRRAEGSAGVPLGLLGLVAVGRLRRKPARRAT